MRYLVLVLSVLILSSCTLVRIDTNSIDNIVNVVLDKENELYNRIGRGYKYYVPRGVAYIDTTDFNEKLYSNGYYYFIYIDVVSYYNQVEFTYEERDDAYYSRQLNVNGNSGYLEINKIDELFFIEFLFNYAKVEAMVYKKDINDVILNASYILSSVKYNDSVIKVLLEDDYFSLIEESYDVFKPKRESRNFLRVEYE